MNARDALVGQDVHPALIAISATEEGGRSVVTINDNAGGIADGIMGSLFDPYFTTKGPEQGTGIGLYMSKAIIEKSMGGTLTVRNVGKAGQPGCPVKQQRPDSPGELRFRLHALPALHKHSPPSYALSTEALRAYERIAALE